VRLVSVADPVADRRDDAVRRFGFVAAHDRWQDAVADPAVHLVSVTAPKAVHREIGCAVAAAGKHLWVEKPVGLGADDARAVADAVSAAGVASAVGFNYRNAPAVERARELVQDGALGEVTHARVQLFSDYAAHPEGALTWRFERATGGAGVLGDLASHGVDLVPLPAGGHRAAGRPTPRCSCRAGPGPVAAGDHFARGGGEPGAVENEDFVAALLRTRSGARVTLEASRVAVGEQNSYSFSVHGSRGSLAWDFRRMGELRLAVNDGADRLPGRADLDRAGRARARRARCVPARRRHRDGLRRPQGDRGRPGSWPRRRAASRRVRPCRTRCMRGGARRDGRVGPHRRLGGRRLSEEACSHQCGLGSGKVVGGEDEPGVGGDVGQRDVDAAVGQLPGDVPEDAGSGR
jgi:predicted dehydrogenase